MLTKPKSGPAITMNMDQAKYVVAHPLNAWEMLPETQGRNETKLQEVRDMAAFMTTAPGRALKPPSEWK